MKPVTGLEKVTFGPLAGRPAVGTEIQLGFFSVSSGLIPSPRALINDTRRAWSRTCGCALLDGGGVEAGGVGVRGSGCQVVKSEMRQGPEVCRGPGDFAPAN